MDAGEGYVDPTDEDAQIAAIADLQREVFEPDQGWDRDDEEDARGPSSAYSGPPHLHFAQYRPVDTEETMIQNMLDVDYTGASGTGASDYGHGDGNEGDQSLQVDDNEHSQARSAPVPGPSSRESTSTSTNYGGAFGATSAFGGAESSEGTPNRVPAQFSYSPEDDDQGGAYTPSYPGPVYSPSAPAGMDDDDIGQGVPPPLSLDDRMITEPTQASEQKTATAPITSVDSRAFSTPARIDTPIDLRSSTPIRPLDNEANIYSPATGGAQASNAAAGAASALSHSTVRGVNTDQAEENEPPKSDLERLSDRLVKDPHDGQLWQEYINLVDQSGDTALIESAYERLIAAFPNTPSAQISYISHYLTPSLFPKAEALFQRFLKPSPSVDLWKYYLTYVRRVNTNANDPVARDTIRAAYEFAVVHVGQDKDSGDIWSEYIEFLKSGNTSNTWEAQQRMDALRSAYHRAVVIPLENVETLWRELDAFETSLNKITAKKFLADLSPSYMTARTSLRELRRLMDLLSIPSIKLPSGTSSANLSLSLPPRPTWGPGESDRSLCAAWKNYIKWEESNALMIEDKDSATLQARISAAYRKAVIRMRFFPEIWFMAFNYLNSSGKADEALALLKQGMESNPTSYVLHFAYAELCESLKKLPEAHAAFEALIKGLHNKLEEAEVTLAAEIENVRESVPSTGVANGELARERDEREKIVTDRHNKDIAEVKGELGVVWVMLMRFARRAEGLRPARSVFARARKDKYCPWSVYEAAALMEYHSTKAVDVSTKIFELGMKLYGTDVDYIVRYLGFLITTNDDTNARALFESVITTFPPDKARPIWERWSRYEYHYGDLTATQKLDKRMAEAFPSDTPIKRFAQRYTYLGIDTIAGRDLGFAQSSRQSPHLAEVSEMNAASSNAPPTGPASDRVPPPRRQSPDNRGRRREPSPPPAKRFKPSSPPPPRRDRDRWDDRDREKERERPPPPRRPSPPPRDRDRDYERDVPGPLMWFIGTLPSATAFDGPVFRTSDLMDLLRHGNIPPPGSSGPPPPHGGSNHNYGPNAAHLHGPGSRPRSPLPPPRDPRSGPAMRGRRY